MTADLTSIDSKIAGLQTASTDHGTKITELTTKTGELDQAIKDEAKARADAVSGLKS